MGDTNNVLIVEILSRKLCFYNDFIEFSFLLLDCTNTVADIIIITDASGSVGSSNYQTLKAFAITLANSFLIGPDETRIGIVDYATGINEGNTFNLNTAAYDNNLEVTEKICGFP